MFEGEDDKVAAHKALRAFTNKHRPSIMKAGMYALDLPFAQSVGERDLVLILLRRRADSDRAETFYFAADISVERIDSFPGSQQLREYLQLALATVGEESEHTSGAMLVLLMDAESLVGEVLPVTFSFRMEEVGKSVPGWPWATWLSTMLNEGLRM